MESINNLYPYTFFLGNLYYNEFFSKLNYENSYMSKNLIVFLLKFYIEEFKPIFICIVRILYISLQCLHIDIYTLNIYRYI